MENPELEEVLAALTLVTGALVAIVSSGRAKETDQINFTGDYVDLGDVTIGEALDAADAVFGKARAAA